MRTRPLNPDPGFTLIELLIASGLLGLITMGMFSAFDTQKQFYNSNERTVETQEDARLVLDLIAFDARMAGFMVPPVAAVSSVDGGANGPDRFCVSESSYFDLPDAATPQTTITSQGERFHISNTQQVLAVTNNSVTVSSLDMDGNSDGEVGENHFGAPGDGLIISDGRRSYCVGIAAINVATNTITLNPFHTGASPVPAFINPQALRAVPAIIYDVVATPALPGALAGGFALTRNGQILSPNIEDLQLEYWVDLSNPLDGDTVDVNESQISNLNDPALTMNTAQIQRLRITVVSRTAVPDLGSTKRFGSSQRPQIANRVAGAADSFGRRVFTTVVAPRNIGLTP